MMKIARYFFSIFCAFNILVFVAQDEVLGATKLRTVIVSDPINLDPAQISFAQDRLIAHNVFQGLIAFDLSKKPPYPVVPVLAKSYKISEDAKMVTFELHKNIQFHHDYGEFTSEDVAFTLRRHLDPKVASLSKTTFSNVERIETPDKYTVKIFLNMPTALSLIQNLAWTSGCIMSKRAYEKLGAKIERMPIGTGPYYFDQWEPAGKVVLKKFNKYWRKPARIDEVELWIIPEETVALGALEKGDLDLVPITQQGSYERAKAIKGIYLAESIGGSARLYLYYINHGLKPMGDVRVRRALAHALDIKAICARIGPMLKPWSSPLPPVVFSATDENWKYEYNVEKAKKLLSEAGYPKGFELRLIYNKVDLYEPISLEVQRYWSKIVDVKLELIDRAVWVKTLRKGEQHVAMYGRTTYAPELYAEHYQTGSPYNYYKYSNPVVDKSIEKARTSRSEEEASINWREFQKIVTEDAVNIWIGNGMSIVSINNKVKDVLVMPSPGLVFLEGAYIE